MRRKHRLYTSALALSLLAGVPAVSAAATMPIVAAEEAETVTVTINGAKEGVTYKAYQVFKGTFDSNKTTLSDVVWGTGVVDAEIQKAVVAAGNPFGFATDATPSAREIADAVDGTNKLAFRKIVSDNVTGDGTEAGSVTNNKATISVEPGYYLITETAGDETRSFLMGVFGKDDTINVKDSSKPNSEKHVHENYNKPAVNNGMLTAGDKGYQDVADYNIGDTVPFVLKAANLPIDTSIADWNEYKIVFKDTMSDGLTFQEDSLKVYAVEKPAADEDGAESTVFANLGTALTTDKYSVNTTDTDATFKVIVDLKANTDLCGKVLIVTFDAVLNTKAKHNLPDTVEGGNYNKFILDYSNNPNSNTFDSTLEDKTLVFTYDLEIKKVDGSDKEKPMLANASFKLYKVVEGTKLYYKDTDGVVTFVPGEDNGTILTSAADENIVVHGIDEGTYFLKETAAPDGYNKLTQDVEIILSADKKEKAQLADTVDDVHGGVTTTANGEIVKNGTVVVENKKGAALPSTGGMGTTLFYAVGGVMVAGAAVFMITGKRARKED